MTRFRVGSATDTGRIRSNNQDSKLVSDNLFAVADGMGGHQGGEVASALAVSELRAAVHESSQQALTEGFRLANEAIYRKASDDPELRGMGTTLAAMTLIENELGQEELAWANVGDSRIYRFRDGELLQLSRDHSLVEDLRRDGQLTEEEAAVHPQRNILTRALGIDADVEIDSETVAPFVGDRYLLCSDGLFNEVELDRISATLRRLADPDEAAAELVRQSNEHGGRDNTTCVIIDVIDDDDRAGVASAALAGDESGLDSPTRQVDMTDHEAPVPPSPGRFGDDSSRDSDLPFGQAKGQGQEYDHLDRSTTRHITWRVILFLLALLVVGGVAFGAVTWYANGSYYVAFTEQDEVAIFQGQPEGVLWIEPEIDETFPDLRRDDLTGVQQERVQRERTYTSRDDAVRAVETLEFEVTEAERQAETPTTTAPTTTAPAGPADPTTTTTP